VLAVVLLAGCNPWWDVGDTYDPIFSEIPHPFFDFENPPIPDGPPSPPYPTLVYPFLRWMRYRIDYVSDDTTHNVLEYWQSPDQTYLSKKGDCEDFTVLGMYLIRQELGGWPGMVIGRIYQNGVRLGGHAWIEYEGRQYEATMSGSEIIDGRFEGLAYKVVKIIPYGEAMWRSMNTHRSLLSEIPE